MRWRSYPLSHRRSDRPCKRVSHNHSAARCDSACTSCNSSTNNEENDDGDDAFYHPDGQPHDAESPPTPRPEPLNRLPIRWITLGRTEPIHAALVNQPHLWDTTLCGRPLHDAQSVGELPVPRCHACERQIRLHAHHGLLLQAGV